MMTMNEIWKDIIIEKNGVIYDYSGKYQVSNMGRVRNLDYRGTGKAKEIIVNPNKKGYKSVRLRKYGEEEARAFSIHRLVATAFIPNPDNLPVVNHKDENPSNNHVDNLEWCTVQYNTNYGTCQQRRSESRKGKHHTEEAKQKMSEAHKGHKPTNPKKVICIETKQVFNSIREAKQWLGKGNIESCLGGRRKTAGGYHWMYYENYLAQQENVELLN